VAIFPEDASLKSAAQRAISAVLVGVLIYGVFIVYTGLGEMGDSLRGFGWSALFFAIMLATLNYFLRFLRWQYYLRLLDVRGVGVADSLLVFLSGFVLTITPGKVGEMFKSAVLEKTHDVPIERTAPVVVVERLSDLLGVVTLILVGSIGFESGLPWALAGALAVGFGFAMILWERPSNALVAWFGRHPRLSRFEPKLQGALLSLRLLSRPKTLPYPVFLSIVAWAAEGVSLWVLLRGFGAKASLLLAVFFYETSSLAGALIPVPGGLGVVEAMLREQLVFLGGVPAPAATASMLLVRIATLWWAVLLGFVALGILRVMYPRLRSVTAA
jgi:uncharacterized membrane protein YbhN (UPF0104 family)